MALSGSGRLVCCGASDGGKICLAQEQHFEMPQINARHVKVIRVKPGFPGRYLRASLLRGGCCKSTIQKTLDHDSENTI